MVKQVKTKTTLKVRFPCLLWTILGSYRAFAGPLAYVSSLRRRVDVYRKEPVLQDGVERDGVCTANKDYCVQKRRGHRDWKEVTYLCRPRRHLALYHRRLVISVPVWLCDRYRPRILLCACEQKLWSCGGRPFRDLGLVAHTWS